MTKRQQQIKAKQYFADGLYDLVKEIVSEVVGDEIEDYGFETLAEDTLNDIREELRDEIVQNSEDIQSDVDDLHRRLEKLEAQMKRGKK